MKITPIEIYRREFRRKTWNGLDPEEVEDFLYRIAEGVEAILNENEELRRRLASGNGDPPTVETGQAQEEVKRQAAQILNEARQQAQGILEDAQTQAAQFLAHAEGQTRKTQDSADPPEASQAEEIRVFAESYRQFLEGQLGELRRWLYSEERLPLNFGGADDEPTTEPVSS